MNNVHLKEKENPKEKEKFNTVVCEHSEQHCVETEIAPGVSYVSDMYGAVDLKWIGRNN